MSAAAGTPLALIEAELAERGQELAFEPADYGALLGGEAGRQSIGGVFACNLAGPRRLKAGAARDHLLGLHCVTGHGQEIKTGGRVVKNVTGYDLCKLLTGSYGTLAVLTQVTFKVMPRAEASLTLLATGPDEPTLLALLRAATGTPCEISGAAYLPPLAAGRSRVDMVRPAARGVAAIRLEGFAPSIAYRSGLLQQLLDGPGHRLRQHRHRGHGRALARDPRRGAAAPRSPALAAVGAARLGGRAGRLDGRAELRADVRLGRRADLAGAEGGLGAAGGDPARGAGRAWWPCDAGARAGEPAARGRCVRAAAARAPRR